MGVVLRRLIAVASLVSWSASAFGAERVIWVDAAAEPNSGIGSEARPYKTIGGALKDANAGTTVLIRAGVYRETLKVPSGAPNRPLVVRAVGGRRVILTDSRPVTGWRRHTEKVWAVRLDFRPRHLYLRGRPQPIAREPEDGWWVAESATRNSLNDPRHLKGIRHALLGGEARVWTQKSYGTHDAAITALDREGGTITLADPSGKMRLYAGDRYFLRNAPDLINRPGEWALREAEANDRWDVYYHPPKADDLKAVEAPEFGRSYLIDLAGANHVVIEGLEVCCGSASSIYLSGCEDVTIRRCAIHDNRTTGITLRDCRRVRIENNVLWGHNYEISFQRCHDVSIERNDIRLGGSTAIGGSQSAGAIIRRNCIRGDMYQGVVNAVGIGLGSVTDARVEENLLTGVPTAVSVRRGSGVRITGNTLAGSVSHLLSLSYEPNRVEIRGNTLAFACYAAAALSGADHRFLENVCMAGCRSGVLNVSEARGYVGDRNLLFASLIDSGGFSSPKKGTRSLIEFRKLTGQEAASTYEDPRFRSAPLFVRRLDGRRLHECTTSRLCIYENAQGFAPGDIVEINLDGVPRKVTAVEDQAIVVDPPARERPYKSWIVFDWCDRRVCRWDLRLGPRSPGLKLGADGGPVGSGIDIHAYWRGDFDADGKSDVPQVPD